MLCSLKHLIFSWSPKKSCTWKPYSGCYFKNVKRAWYVPDTSSLWTQTCIIFQNMIVAALNWAISARVLRQIDFITNTRQYNVLYISLILEQRYFKYSIFFPFLIIFLLYTSTLSTIWEYYFPTIYNGCHQWNNCDVHFFSTRCALIARVITIGGCTLYLINISLI